MADKLDLYKLFKSEYVTPKKPVLITVAPAKYLVVDGTGAPGSEMFDQRMGALFGAAYTIKFAWKKAGKQDYKVCGLEGLWWTGEEGSLAPASAESWRWKMMIRIPEFITVAELEAAFVAQEKKGKDASCRVVTIETIDEGTCVQMLHVGPYATEAETIKQMSEFAFANKLSFTGAHHEIYLSDPRRVPPERLRTLLRHPVKTRG